MERKPPRRRWLWCVLGLMCGLLLVGCAAEPAAESKTSTAVYEPGLYASDWTAPLADVAHGEDYCIEWQDPCIEACVRLWLGRPEERCVGRSDALSELHRFG